MPRTLRVATFNVWDIRSEDLARRDHPRLARIAALVQEVRPDLLLLNEIAYDMPGAPGFAGGAPGQNARRFAEHYLAVAQAPGLAPLLMTAFMREPNTGQPSGFDLDGDGAPVRYAAPPLPPAPADDTPGPFSAEGQRYADDCLGFGAFPGQYGMALLAGAGVELVAEEARTFQRFSWHALPGATRPTDPATGAPFYSDAAWAALPLSSKSHWDVPVRTADGAVVHVLCSHPVPPAFDGPERRNHWRNRDEIRFWQAYLDDHAALVDDRGRRGGLPAGEPFVLLGDLNADGELGSAIGDPVRTLLMTHPRVNAGFTPVAPPEQASAVLPSLPPTATADFGLRVDYVLPSTHFEVCDGRVERRAGLSDHFMVWLDLARRVSRA